MTKITETAQRVLEERYFLKDSDGNLIETEWHHLVDRVSKHFATSREEEKLFTRMMEGLDSLPNSPTLMNAGTEITSYSACFVLPVKDSIPSIFKYISDAALISKSGGGVGANLSAIREKGASVGSTGGVASGPISFAKIQDAATQEIKQGGKRKGANMGILSCGHPDILEFIKAKDTPGVLENFNLSVGVTDEFMSLVTDPKQYHGLWKGLWDEMMIRAHSSGEPGVLFMDTIEKGNLVPHLGKLDSCNPCGEQPLLPYESCSLIAVNLSNHICNSSNTDTLSEPYIDWSKLSQTVHTSVLFMNRVLDKSKFPIPECQGAMEETRKIGVGIMGLHDLLIQLDLPYDSKEGREIAGEVMTFIAKEADVKSRELGISEGFYKGVWKESSLTERGCPQRRNAHLTTIAPTGTLSMIADCSSGCEPYYAPVTVKTVLDGEEFVMPNKWLPEDIKKILEGNSSLTLDLIMEEPEYSLYKGAEEIHWKSHILMQAELQKSVDSAISKTINMSSDATVAEVKEAYEFAWKSGCKGLTIYRDGSRSEQVLSTTTDRGVEETDSRSKQQREEVSTTSLEFQSEGLRELPTPFKLQLPDNLEATRYRIRDIDGNKVYFTVCVQDDIPVEVFARLPEEVSDSSWHTICRLLSLCLRYNVPLDDCTKQLRKSSSSVSDVPSRLARILDEYKEEERFVEILEDTPTEGYDTRSRCPGCGSILVPEGGCMSCKSCGWEKCQ